MFAQVLALAVAVGTVALLWLGVGVVVFYTVQAQPHTQVAQYSTFKKVLIELAELPLCALFPWVFPGRGPHTL